MFKWINNRMIALAITLTFGIWLPAGVAVACGHYHYGYGLTVTGIIMGMGTAMGSTRNLKKLMHEMP